MPISLQDDKGTSVDASLDVWLSARDAIHSFLIWAGLSRGQHMLFHLLGVSEPIANFTTTSQTMAEADGVWSPWSSSLSAWTKRRQILLDGVTGSLADFPVMVKLDSTRIDYAQVQDSGQDLRFTDSSGNLLSYEIENWNESGTSVAWVKVPTLSAYPTKTSVWMYYGNAAASDAQAATTWDASHLGVWHLDGDGTDSTSSANNGTVTGASAATGLVANALSYTGAAGESVRLPDTMISNKTVATFEGWFKSSSNDVPAFGWANQVYPTVPTSYVPVLNITSDGVLRSEQWTGTNSPISAGAVNDGSWHHVALVVNSTIQTLYLDGVNKGSLAGNIVPFTSTANYIGMGYSTNWGPTAGGWRSFNGQLDEFRISSVVRSADWIKATYLSARDELTTFRSEETPTSGAAVITVGLNTPATSTITIPYTVSGTATGGTDHSRVNGNLVINGGESSGSLNTYILRDNLVEGSETAILTLGAPSGATLGPDTVHTVTITDEVLSPPDAVDDSVNLTTLGAVTIPVLANDTDANGDTLTIASFTSPSNGSVARVAQQLVYTPSGDFAATDSFTYTISDSRGGSDTATVTLNYQIPFTWLGSGADANWITAANWLGGVVPGNADTVYFNNQCTTYCSPIQTGNISVAGLRMNTSYAGTIAQVTGYTIIVGASGWTQKAGTFTGASSNVTSSGGFTLSGGTFTAPSATLTVSGGNFVLSGAPTFNANGGTLYLGCGYTLTCTVTPGSAAYNNVTFGGYYSNFTLGGATMSVGGNLSMGDTHGSGVTDRAIDSGTIDVTGNVSVINNGNMGSAIVRLVGNASGQTITGLAGKYMPGLTIAAGTNAVTFSGTVNVSSHYTYTSGTLTVTGSTLSLYCGWSATCNITPGTVAYNNVSIVGKYTTYNFGGGTMSIDGNLSLGDTQGAGYTSQPINNGTLDVKGNIAIINYGYRGSAVINSISGDTTLSHAASAGIPTGTFTVNKTAKTNTLTLSSNVTFVGPAQAMTVTQGTLNLAGYNLTVPGAFTVGTNAKVICNGGTITAGSSLITGEISCGTSLGITWTGLAGDGLWTTAGNWTNNTIPGASDIAYFNGSCTNCNVTMNTNVNVKGIVAASTYTGTMTQGAANTITVGASGWLQYAGTFSGASSAITVNGTLGVNSGTFTSTSGTLNANGNFTVSGSATFNHGSGSVIFYNNNGATTVAVATASFNNATFGAYYGTLTLSGTFNVLGTLTVHDPYAQAGLMNGGTIVAFGNVNFTGAGKTGSSLIKIAGSVSQTVTGVSGARIPNFEIASTGGTVALSGTLYLDGSYTYTSGTVDAGTSTLHFFSQGSASRTLVPGSIGYNNVVLGGTQLTLAVTGTMTVNGTLTISDVYYVPGGINTGTILANGDVVISNYGKVGTGTIKIGGAANQSVTASGNARLQNFQIASTGGIVSLAGSLLIYGNYTYTSGTVDSGTSTLVFTSAGSSTATVTPGPADYYNVTFTGFDGTQVISGTMSVLGTLTVGDTYSSTSGAINTGTILAKGSVTFNNYGKKGNALIKVAGSTNQTITGVSTALIPKFEVASTGGVVTLSGTLRMFQTYTHTSGTVDAGTSTVSFSAGNYSTGTFVPGATEFNIVKFEGYQTSSNLTGTLTVNGLLTLTDDYSTAGTISGGTIVAKGNVSVNVHGKGGSTRLQIAGASSQTLTGSVNAQIPNLEIMSTGGTVSYSGTLRLYGDYIYSSGTVDVGTANLVFNASSWGTFALTPGAIAYNSVTFGGYSTHYNLTGSLTVNGALSFADTYGLAGLINGGTITANGNVSSSGGGKRGSALLAIAGAAPATLATSSAGYVPGSVVTINKPGSTLTLTQASFFTNGTQDLTITDGTVDMAGYNFTVGRNISNSGTLKRGNNPTCGTLSYSGSYSGNAAVCP